MFLSFLIDGVGSLAIDLAVQDEQARKAAKLALKTTAAAVGAATGDLAGAVASGAGAAGEGLKLGTKDPNAQTGIDTVTSVIGIAANGGAADLKQMDVVKEGIAEAGEIAAGKGSEAAVALAPEVAKAAEELTKQLGELSGQAWSKVGWTAAAAVGGGAAGAGIGAAAGGPEGAKVGMNLGMSWLSGALTPGDSKLPEWGNAQRVTLAKVVGGTTVGGIGAAATKGDKEQKLAAFQAWGGVGASLGEAGGSVVNEELGKRSASTTEPNGDKREPSFVQQVGAFADSARFKVVAAGGQLVATALIAETQKEKDPTTAAAQARLAASSLNLMRAAAGSSREHDGAAKPKMGADGPRETMATAVLAQALDVTEDASRIALEATAGAQARRAKQLETWAEADEGSDPSEDLELLRARSKRADGRYRDLTKVSSGLGVVSEWIEK